MLFLRIFLLRLCIDEKLVCVDDAWDDATAPFGTATPDSVSIVSIAYDTVVGASV